MSATAQAYLQQLLYLDAANSVNRYKIDWTSFRQSVYDWTVAARTVHDVVVSGDPVPRSGSSMTTTTTSSEAMADRLNPPLYCYDTRASAVAVPGDIGYVKVGSTSTR